MNGFERRKREKQRSIIGAAKALIAERGAAVSIADIAERAGVSPATIYNYFDNRTGLLAAIIRHECERQLDEYDRLLTAPLTFPAKTAKLLQAERANLTALAELLRSERGESSNGELLEVWNEAEEGVRSFFRRYAALGKREGAIDQAIDDETLLAYFEMYSRELSRMLASTERDRIEVRIAQWVALFFHGISGKSR